jgi:DNA-binding response OmpR family regulator
MAEKILVVEDEPALREALAYNLMRDGYQVETAGDGRAALEKASTSQPDLIVLDIMLPGLDGFEITRIVRKASNVPILMLTARDDEIDRILGLELGADDYLTKPFSMREFLARVKAVIRRVRLDREEVNAKKDVEDEILTFGNLSVDKSRREVRLEGQALKLKPKEYDLLLHLAKQRGRVVSRQTLLEQVWGWDFSGGSRTVDVHIRWLRQKIEPDPTNPSRIITIRGVGYRFEG